MTPTQGTFGSGGSGEPRRCVLCVGVTPCLQRTLFFRTLIPGAVNRASRVLHTASGKGTNVARVLGALGGRARLLDVVGGDTGTQFLRLLEPEVPDHRWVEVEAPTRICQTLIGEKNGEVTELVEEAGALTVEEWDRFVEVYRRGLDEVDFVVISGSPPPGSPETIYRDLVAAAGSKEIRVLLDAQKLPMRRALEARPWMVKLNAQELGQTMHLPVDTPAGVDEAASAMLAAGAGCVVVTQGSREIVLIERGGVSRFLPPEVETVNPIGSGDSMAAGIAGGLQRGGSIEDAMILGIACGAANARSPTSGVVNPEDVERLVPAVRRI